MPIGCGRIIDSVAFVLAVAAAVCVRYGFETNWYAAIGLAVIVFALTPFILSRFWAMYLIRRMERATRGMGDLDSGERNSELWKSLPASARPTSVVLSEIVQLLLLFGPIGRALKMNSAVSHRCSCILSGRGSSDRTGHSREKKLGQAGACRLGRSVGSWLAFRSDQLVLVS